MHLTNFRAGRLVNLCGNGYFAGEAPASSDPDAPDGRAKIVNVPSRVLVGVFQRQTMLCVATALSTSAGLWRINGLDPAQTYTVIGFDGAGAVNAAIQDWVRPESYDPASLRPMRLVGEVGNAAVGAAFSAKVRAAYAAGPVHFTVTAGSLPPGWSMSELETTCFFTGPSTTTGSYSFELTGEDANGVLASRTFNVLVSEAYKFWRIEVTANNGNASYATIAELEMRAFAGGGDQAIGGTATASSIANSDNQAAYAFDNNLESKWTPSARPTALAPQWVQYEFAAPVTVKQIAMTGCIAGQTDMAPRDFTVLYSSDGSAWTPAGSFTAQTGWAGGETRTFNLS